MAPMEILSEAVGDRVIGMTLVSLRCSKFGKRAIFLTNAIRTALCLVALLPLTASARAPTNETPQTASLPGQAYPDSPVGLRDFLQTLITAIKSNDKSIIEPLWSSTLLPNHAAWFAQVFGEQEGARLETNYTKQLATSASGPGVAFQVVAGLDNLTIQVLPLAQAAVNRPDSWAKPIYLSMKEPIHAYRAEAKSAGESSSHMLGYFFYVDDGFREIEELVFSALSATKRSPGLPYISALDAQLLLMQSAQPVAPPGAKRPGISNTVMLDVIIDVLGQVRSARILSGDLVLGNAARTAVLGWRYRPFIQNGRAVDVETTVTVTFPF
jgi:TonB family protein